MSYPDEQYYETTDITADVKPGAGNTFEFETFWGPPEQGRPASQPGLIAQITIEHADGTTEHFGTDGTWQAAAAGIVPDHPRNDEGDWVERADERVTPAWTSATDIGPAGTKPFTHLVAARTHIVESMLKPAKVTKVGNAYVADLGAITSATPVVTLQHGRDGSASRSSVATRSTRTATCRAQRATRTPT